MAFRNNKQTMKETTKMTYQADPIVSDRNVILSETSKSLLENDRPEPYDHSFNEYVLICFNINYHRIKTNECKIKCRKNLRIFLHH